MVVEVHEEGERSHAPGQRIGEDQSEDISVQRNCDDDPDNAQHTYTEAGHEHGNPAVAYAAQGTAVDLDHNIAHKGRNQKAQHAHSDGQHCGVGGEERQHIVAEEPEQRGEQHSGSEAQGQTAAYALLYAVHLPGAVVLAHEGSDGDTEGVDDHPVEHIDFSVGCPCGNGIGSEGVDICLNDNVGDGVHGALQSGRETDVDHLSEPAALDAELLQPDLDALLAVVQDEYDHDGADKLRQYGC